MVNTLALVRFRRWSLPLLLTAALAGCGSTSSRPKRSTATPARVTASPIAACARTFQAIIRDANPASAPAWVNYFLPANQAKGYPVAIGTDGALTAQGSGEACSLTFELPTQPSTPSIAYFTPGHSAFDGSSSAPVLEQAQGQGPADNVRIGAYGETTYLTSGAPVAGAEAAATPGTQSTTSTPPSTASTPAATVPGSTTTANASAPDPRAHELGRGCQVEAEGGTWNPTGTGSSCAGMQQILGYFLGKASGQCSQPSPTIVRCREPGGFTQTAGKS